MTPQSVIFLHFVLLKSVDMPIFTVFFEHQPKFGQKWAIQNDNFFTFRKTQVI